MIHPKQHIVDLVEILAQKGISAVIISPGSRNAPLIEAFYKLVAEKCISIVDERSAGYVALGIARNTGKPCALLCTSGTAVLNYGPAIAEAWHQQIPLIVITADRPAEWVNQLDNQTLRQDNIFSNIIKAFYNLPQALAKEDDLWFVYRLINEAFNTSVNTNRGPVHINVPLGEPLYDPLPPIQGKIRNIELADLSSVLYLSDRQIEQWKNARKILIIHGQDIPQSAVSKHLENLTKDKRVTVIAENISNTNISRQIESPDLVLANSGQVSLKPDLLIVSGLQVVSKQLKSFLRKAENLVTWRIGDEETIIDTYQQVNVVLKCSAEKVYKALVNYIQLNSASDYQDEWIKAKEYAIKVRQKLLNEIPFSDLKVFSVIFETIPDHSVIELGNSSVIRYSQLFDSKKDILYFSNRGVSGIDGCLSTAVGTALSTDKLVIAIIGDLSFIYDSNALWNRALPSNLRIIVINNNGGGIFQLIDGPQKNTSFNEFVNAFHPAKILKIAEAFNLNYLSALDDEELKKSLSNLYSMNDKASILEIVTSAEVSATYYKKILGK